MSKEVARPRYIVLLDLDSFYVAVHRKLNPKLVGLPVGVQQKSILATCSYEARAQGVDKLMNVSKAKLICPSMVVVNGEDLTPFRRASKQVREVVTDIVGPFEGSGMDECWFDISNFVRTARFDGETATVKLLNTSLDIEVSSRLPDFFSMPLEDETLASYDYIASRIAAYVREEIFNRTGYDTTCGIAPNKTLSKLLASTHKPRGMTVWNARNSEDLDRFMSSLKLRQLGGWGHEYCARLSERLSPDEELTVPNVKRLGLDVVNTLFGERLGNRLWAILQGTEEEHLVPTPKFPSSITVEDSYASRTLMTAKYIQKQLHWLAGQLVRRMEEELCEKGRWQRFPSSCRLSLRMAVSEGRISQSDKLPVEFFSGTGTSESRVGILEKTFSNLFWLMLDKDKKEHDIYVINLGVTNLLMAAPGRSIAESIASRGKRKHNGDLIVTIDSSSEDEVQFVSVTKKSR